ncbi:MAG TPA: hypothetical protein ENI31_05530 [Candidatus Omnitrophica bacterium]|nr:hypothetical protein [Candidatus Omnitrophota bacterium]
MKIIKDEISLQELKKLAEESFGNLVKAVVDVEREVMAIGGELHSDEEALLIEDGSNQRSLWGINLYPHTEEKDWIEFDSVINIRPSQGNLSRNVDNPQIKDKIIKIVNKLVKR